jgi:hypothetical protein
VRPPADPELEHSCPLLWELLTLDSYSDGTNRVLADLRIERMSGGYVVTVLDHASNQQASAYAATLSTAARALELQIGSGEDCWRPYKSFKVKDPLKRSKREKS